MQWVVRKIQGGKAVNIGRDNLIYADRVALQAVTDKTGPPPHPHQRLILEGVAIGKMIFPEKAEVEKGADNYRSLSNSHTARRAVIDFYRDRDLGRNFATMLLHDVAIQDRESDRFVAADQLAFNALEIPGALDENLQFLSKPRLKMLMRDPMRSEDIRRAHHELALAVATQRLLDAVARDAGREGPLVFKSTGGLQYELRAAKVTRRPMGLQLGAEALHVVRRGVRVAGTGPQAPAVATETRSETSGRHGHRDQPYQHAGPKKRTHRTDAQLPGRW